MPLTDKIHKITYTTEDNGECDRGCCSYSKSKATCTCGWREDPCYGSKRQIEKEHELEVIRAILGIKVFAED